jgi:BASS family bile acid:Na+ symporter
MLEKLGRINNWIAKYMTVWIIIGAIIAYNIPGPIAPLASYSNYCIMAVMLSMGLTVSLEDFRLVLTRPLDVFWGVLFRYLIMPFVAFGIVHLLSLPTPLAVGLILVGCCPSGVASNVMTYLSRGDSALSITLSTVNTLLSPLLTPLMFTFLAGSMIKVPTGSLILSITEIVIVPVIVGALLHTFLPKVVEFITPFVPLISVLAILITTSSGVAKSADMLANVALVAALAVVLHNLSGLTLGYWSARAVRMPRNKAKALCFEIGMENGGLAMTLALTYLAPVAVIPAAIFNVVHNITGPTLAAYWRQKDSRAEAITATAASKGETTVEASNEESSNK